MTTLRDEAGIKLNGLQLAYSPKIVDNKLAISIMIRRVLLLQESQAKKFESNDYIKSVVQKGVYRQNGAPYFESKNCVLVDSFIILHRDKFNTVFCDFDLYDKVSTTVQLDEDANFPLETVSTDISLHLHSYSGNCLITITTSERFVTIIRIMDLEDGTVGPNSKIVFTGKRGVGLDQEDLSFFTKNSEKIFSTILELSKGVSTKNETVLSMSDELFKEVYNTFSGILMMEELLK